MKVSVIKTLPPFSGALNRPLSLELRSLGCAVQSCTRTCTAHAVMCMMQGIMLLLLLVINAVVVAMVVMLMMVVGGVAAAAAVCGLCRLCLPCRCCCCCFILFNII